MTPKAQPASAEITRVGKFGFVGILNTGLDFVIYDLLFAVVGIDVRIANIISTTCAMVFSFFANKQMVFTPRGGSWIHQAIKFYLVTAFGLYVLQTGTIHILTDVWTGPVNLAVGVVHLLGLSDHLGDTFVINNAAKAFGTIVSLTWNYITYKKIVFL